MKKRPFQFLSLAIAAFFAMSAQAEDHPLWLRHCAISPDGTQIAFCYKGDIFTVPAAGGQARQLTSNAAYDGNPVWSPNGQQIAFMSNREGSMDIYVMSKDGGTPKRLTTDSGDETPIIWRDNSHVLFSAALWTEPKSIIFPSRQFPQVYEVDVNGSRPVKFSDITMEDMSLNAKGQILYHDKKGYEDTWRKHHTSPITRDIWLDDNGKFTKLTSFKGEDRNPVWNSKGDGFWYLSEQDGTFNVYQRPLQGNSATQLTHFSGNPVRFLSASKGGKLCFSQNGELYTLVPGQQPQKVNVSIVADSNDKDVVRRTLTGGATEFCLSPSGKEIAFIDHGDVFVTSTDYKTTKQITDTPEQERNLSFSPDGRSLVYASERNGLWQVYMTKIKDAKEKQFTYAGDLVEEQLVKSNRTSFMPKFSPDGKTVAFVEDRGTLKSVDVKNHAVKTLMDGKYIFSYSDGDIDYQWSPDSRWIITNYIGNGGWNNADVALVPADGSQKVVDLTESGYNDGAARWALGGKAIAFASDRAGYRSHGSWGAEQDVYLMFLDLDAYERFQMTKEEKERFDEAQKEKKKEEDEAKGKKKNKKGKKPQKKGEKDVKAKPLRFDTENCRDRIVRLTVNSSDLGDFILSPGGDTLYYEARFEDGYDLWRHEMREGKTTLVMKKVNGGDLQADSTFKSLFAMSEGRIKKIDLAKSEIKDVVFEARFNDKPYQERRYLFDHIWQQVKDKFYDPKLHGVDWQGYHDNYARFLPYINNNFDFSEMASEMLGELNASHTGCRYYPNGASLQTAELGLLYDSHYRGDGLKVAEVIKRGPFAVRNTGVTPGCIIEKIDGQRILRNSDYTSLMDGRAGKDLRVSVFNPKTNKHFDVQVRPISRNAQRELLYKRWVDHNRDLVDSLSHGQLAYVHVKAMDSESFRTVFSELLSDKNHNRKAAIIDERHNGGGWLHDDLCTLLSGKEYQEFIAHGKYVGRDPWNKWVKPSCVMICEDDYSNGHGFPFVYKTLGIGKLVGAPVAGTMTAVWWETQMDRSLVFGIPQVGCRDMNGQYGENHQLDPDVEVYNTPEDYLKGDDEQLKKAVETMLK